MRHTAPQPARLTKDGIQYQRGNQQGGGHARRLRVSGATL